MGVSGSKKYSKDSARLPLRESSSLPSKGARIADQIVSALVAQGVDRVFGIPGGPISPVLDALLDANIEHITCQHETMAMYAATGYGRATGKPGVVLVTSGPGVLNALTGLAAAYHDESPVLLLVGEVATKNDGRGALQDGGASGLDVQRMVEPITKYADVLRQPERASSLVAEAFRVMTDVPWGPAVLRLPVDLTTASTPVESTSQVITGDVAPSEEDCRSIARLLATAQRPVIFAGGAVRRAGAATALLELAEWTRCPVITDLEAKGVFPEGHPLSLGIFGAGARGPAAEYLKGEVDLLMTVGARLDDTTTANFSPLLQPKGTMVQIDHDPRRLGRAYEPDIMVNAHLASTLVRLRHHTPLASAQTLLARDAALQAIKPPTEVAKGGILGAAPHDPRLVVSALQRVLPANTIYASDIGNHLLFAGSGLELNLPDQFHASMGLGGMGSGIGVGMGLAAGYGKRRRVVVICGDGSMLMCGNEIATCAKYRIPVTFVVFNDQHLGMVSHGDQRVFGRTHGWSTPNTDFVKMAASMGAHAIRLEGETELSTLGTWAASGPLVVEVSIDAHIRSVNPREAAFNFPQES